MFKVTTYFKNAKGKEWKKEIIISAETAENALDIAEECDCEEPEGYYAYYAAAEGLYASNCLYGDRMYALPGWFR